jgi:lysine-specific demethylase 8
MRISGEIERISNPSPEGFRAASANFTRPVVVTGVVDRWPAQNLLTPEAIKSMFGPVVVTVRESDDEFQYFWQGGAKREVPLGEYIDLISAPAHAQQRRPPYLGNLPFDHPGVARYLSSLKPLFKFPNYFPGLRYGEFRLWMGGGGQRSTIHNDNYHNLNAQLYGSKRFLLFAPEQWERLYVKELNPTCWASPVDPDDFDAGQYARFAEAEAVEATLQRGEMLYIPIFWWHQAAARELSISISMFMHTAVERYWGAENAAAPNVAL